MENKPLIEKYINANILILKVKTKWGYQFYKELQKDSELNINKKLMNSLIYYELLTTIIILFFIKIM